MKAEKDSTGVTVEERYWATVHIGECAALIAAGLATEAEFPGEPGCGKTSTIFRTPDGKRKFKKVSRRSTYWYEVAFYKTPEETAAYEAQVREEIEAVAAARECKVARNGHGRFSEKEATAMVGLASYPGIGEQVFPRLFRETAKQMMWELNLLFRGQLLDSEGVDHFLRQCLSAKQRDEAKEAFQILWGIIQRPKFEHTAFAAARDDVSFLRFMRRAAGDSAPPAAPPS